MRAFDFDGTLYSGDASIDFYRQCLITHPSCLKALPRQLSGACLYVFSRISLSEFKERYFSFLGHLPDIDTAVQNFWSTHGHRFNESVVTELHPNDLIISASPEFLLEPVARKLKAQLIATSVDPQSGRLLGPNCSGDEKVRRCRAANLTGPFDRFYTDSMRDRPMFALARAAYMVQKGRINQVEPDKF